MLIVIGAARSLPGRRAELVAAAQRMVAVTQHDDGRESYGFFADITDGERIVSLEPWRDPRALDEHMDHGHTRDFLEATTGMFDDAPDMTVDEVVRSSDSVEGDR